VEIRPALPALGHRSLEILSFDDFIALTIFQLGGKKPTYPPAADQ
jgi:hypothetical protein